MEVKTYPTLLEKPAYCIETRNQNPKSELDYSVSINMSYIHLLGEYGIRCKAALACNLGVKTE